MIGELNLLRFIDIIELPTGIKRCKSAITGGDRIIIIILDIPIVIQKVNSVP